MKRWLCNLLRSLLHRLEGLESDDELRARTLNLFRKPRSAGRVIDIEQAVVDASPIYMTPTFTWKGARCLTVEWR
jgi:hypothetical protein